MKTRREEIAELRTAALGILEQTKNRPLSAEERTTLDEKRARADALFAEQAAIDRQRAELAEWEAKTLGVEPESKALVPLGRDPVVAKTVGEELVNSPAFGEYKSRRLPFSVEIELKAATMGIAIPAVPTVTAGFDVPMATTPAFPWRVASLLGQGTTDQGAVPYMRLTGFTSGAAVVATGAAKPLSTGVAEFVWAPVITIAHIIIVPNQLLEDAPAFRSTLETKMLNGLVIAEDQQILNGTGLAGQMLGILQTPGLAASVGAASPAFADGILQQYMAIYGATYIPPTGVVLAPDSLYNVATSKASVTGAYFLTGAPFDRSPMPLSIWGLPVAISPALASKTALVGAFKTESILYRHGGIRVAVSESHDDIFAKNATAIRVEERLALAVFTPGAFGVVTGLGPAVQGLSELSEGPRTGNHKNAEKERAEREAREREGR